MNLINNRFDHKRRRTGNNKTRFFAALCLLIGAVVFLTSCGGASPTKEKRDACKNLAPTEVGLASGHGDLYEITQQALPDEDSVLCCTGMYDETHVLLLQGDKAQDGTISGYTVQLLDLCSFDIEQLCAFKRENAPGSAADGSERLDFLSADPLVIHDALSGVLYMPGSTVGAVVIPGYLRDAVPFLMGVYYLADIIPSMFSVYAGGRLLGSSFRSKPTICVCDPSAHVKKEMALPDDVLALLSPDDTASAPGSTEDSFLAFTTCPLSLCKDWCLWSLCDDSGRPVRLYLWDTASCKGEKWNGPTVSEYSAPQPVVYDGLTDRAKALEDKYGIRVFIGANIPAEFADYSAGQLEETTVIDGSLSVLENALSAYPDSYFRALKGDYYRDIAFYLTGALRPLNAESNISNAGAFATESNGTMQLAFDLNDDLSPDTVIHELTHAADYRFAGEGTLDEGLWNSMNPEGFSYYYAYIDENGVSYEFSGSPDHTAMNGCAPDDVWFIDPYSKTFPMEDRARLMENLLSGHSPYKDCFAGRHVQEKLSFYFRFLRETLGDDTWPAQTAWEEALSEFTE